jgi:hypothetical protein
MSRQRMATAEQDRWPEADIPHIARTLERLCTDCGFDNVLGVFSDLPVHCESLIGSNDKRQSFAAADRVYSALSMREETGRQAMLVLPNGSANRFESGCPSQRLAVE